MKQIRWIDFGSLDNVFGFKTDKKGCWDVLEMDWRPLPAWNKGISHSEETKRLMSERQKGEKNSFFGQKHTEESRKQMSESAKKRDPEWKVKQRIAQSKGREWIFVNPEGEVIQFTGSLNYFCKQNGLNTGAMAQVHKGNSKQHKGWTNGSTK